MRLLNREAFRELVESSAWPSVSLFLPTHPVWTESAQDRIRLKNLLNDAEKRMVGRGVRREEARGVLEPARRLLKNDAFWRRQSDGLALFLSPGNFRSWRVPLALEELVAVGDRFLVKPVLPLLGEDGRFYLLAFSKKSVRLFEGTRDSIRGIDLEDIPESLRDAVGYDREQKSLQFHTSTAGQAGPRREAIFHGHGATTGNEAKGELEKFFRAVDRGLGHLLHDKRPPLVLAAVDYLIPLYRKVSRYPTVLEKGIEGNPDALSARELHARARGLLEPRWSATREKARATWGDLSGSDRAAVGLEAVLPAAFEGRVQVLFVPTGEHRWGRFHRAGRTVEVHRERVSGDEELLDLAVALTLARDGTVHPVAPGGVPGGGAVAAITRY